MKSRFFNRTVPVHDHTATDFNNHSGMQTVVQGAQAVVRLATLERDGPTGGYFNAAGPLPW